MYKVGVFFGKFYPPHRGHLYQIVNGCTQCEKFYVVLSGRGNLDIPDEDRIRWLIQATCHIGNVKIVYLNEKDIPEYPLGWAQWCDRLECLIPEHIDVFFCGESEYMYELKTRFDAEVVVFDERRIMFPISSTEIRKDPLKYWDYILTPARPHFCKKVLIAGPESVGKTTLTTYLSMIYNTSHSEEYGREYVTKYMGGNESHLKHSDFSRIAFYQKEQDCDALRHANKVCFFDTDAVYTQFFEEAYLGSCSEDVNKRITPEDYDMVLFLSPNVPWVNDGMRSRDQSRFEDSSHLFLKYYSYGFKNIHFIDGDYNNRLKESIRLVDRLMSIDILKKEI